MEPTIEETNKKRINFKLWSPKRDIKILKWGLVAVFLIASLIVINDELRLYTGFYDDYLSDEEAITDDTATETCNTMGLILHGTLVTYISPSDYDKDGNLLEDQTASEDIVYWINEAEKDPEAKAIFMEVDSYGGYPVAAEEVALALKQAKKPTVALIREVGVSAAYWAASGADIIFASKNSDVGSIGITMSYLDNTKQNQQEGLTYNQISLGKFKDAGDPNKPLTSEERQLFVRDIEIIYEDFIKAVAENRGLNVEEVKKMADGSSMLGQMALENGLIDRIGGMAEVKNYLKEKIGEEAEICW